MLSQLPTSRDAFYDLSLTTPGMFDHGSNAGWLPSPTAYGGSSNENVFLVNGVNTTNPRGSSFGSLVKVNYNAVEEVRVVALGSKAEYGSFSGAAIDVLTKSGSNSFHGNAGVLLRAGQVEHSRTSPSDAATYGTDLALDRRTRFPANNLYGAPPPANRDYELNATLGGPIVKDKVWFYGGFDYLQRRHPPRPLEHPGAEQRGTLRRPEGLGRALRQPPGLGVVPLTRTTITAAAAGAASRSGTRR